jgi:hypothetical protein
MAAPSSSDAFLHACPANETMPVAKLLGSLAYTNFLTIKSNTPLRNAIIVGHFVLKNKTKRNAALF